MLSNSLILLGIYLAIFVIPKAHAQIYWFDQKKYHQLANFSDEELAKFAFPTNKANFENLLEPILIPRVGGTSNDTKVAKYIEKTLKDLGWNIYVNQIPDKNIVGYTFYGNVVATMESYYKTNRRLVLACHFDSKMINLPFIGATDSAVPCSMLLDMAHSLKEFIQSIRDTKDHTWSLQFIFFDGREVYGTGSGGNDRFRGTYGSRHLAKFWGTQKYLPKPRPTNSLHRMDCMILLDTLGAPKPEIPTFKSNARWYHELAAIEASLRKTNLWTLDPQGKPFFTNESKDDLVDDHTAFHTAKTAVDVVHVVPQPFPLNYHEPGDDKNALDFDTIDHWNRILRVFVARYLKGKSVIPPDMDGARQQKCSEALVSSLICILFIVFINNGHM